jgi:hypothetical protein
MGPLVSRARRLGERPKANMNPFRYARLDSFLNDRAAVSALEFALILPVLSMLLLGGFDMGRFILATQRTQAVANSIAEMLSQTPVSSSASVSGDGVVTQNDVLFYYNSAMFTFPDILTEATQLGVNWWNLLGVNIASVSFKATPTGCTTSCAYVPKLVWSFGARTCGTTFTAVPDTNTFNPATLPTDVYAAGSLIVVDITYNWQPTFGAQYLGAVSIERSVFMEPRNVPLVESNATGLVSICS